MGFTTMIAGFILLFNPVIHVVDIIPDAIGFFLIVAGLTKMSYFIEKIAMARDIFLKLAFLEVAKFFAIVLIPYTSGSAKVLMAFVFGFAELLFFIPAVNTLFEGLSFAGLWYEGTALYDKKTIVRRKKTKEDGVETTRTIEMISHVRRWILFFYTFRVVATLAPELTELEMYDYLGEVKAIQRSLVSYKPFLYVVFGLAVLILGAIYIKKVVSYFNSVKRDTVFIRNLTEKFENDVLPRETLFIARGMKRALLLFSLSVAASFILFMDGVNLLVGVLSAAFLIAAAWIVRKYVKFATVVIPVSIVRALLSIVNFVLQFRYYAEYTEEAIDWIEAAYDQYYTMAMMESIEYIVALAAFMLFLTALMKAVKGHLEVCGIQTENAQYSKRNRDLETYNTIGGQLLLCAILTILHTVFACAYHYLVPDFTVIGVLTASVSLIFIAYSLYTAHSINVLLYDKELEMN